MSNRREFLKQTALAAGALTLSATRLDAQDRPAANVKPLRLLILGGTGFIGPHFVRAAAARGHQVSVFNRGKSDAQLPAAVERLVGDRTNNLDSIRNRDWDAVLDLAVYVPGWVRSLGEALQGRVRHYTFISTESVYDIPEGFTGIVTEGSPVHVYKGPDPFALTDRGDQYGALKVVCEQEAERQFQGKTLVLRPDLIAGPGDPYSPLMYWPVRMRKGGEILVAGNPSMPVQFVDIRDLAEWTVRMIEQGATGTYNAVGPEKPLTFGEVLNAAGTVTSTSPKLTWVPASFINAQQQDTSLRRVTYWTAEDYGNRCGLSNARAVASGFRTRSVKTTVKDTVNWYDDLPADQQAALLEFWKQKEDGSGYEKVVPPWSTYLQREKQVLAAWRTEKSKHRVSNSAFRGAMHGHVWHEDQGRCNTHSGHFR